MIFVDRSIPKPVAEALKLVRNDVRWLEDEFAHDTPDAVWLAAVGVRGWLVVCRDKHIRTRPGERQAIVDGQVGCFCLTQKQSLTRWQYLKLLALTRDGAGLCANPSPVHLWRRGHRAIAAAGIVAEPLTKPPLTKAPRCRGHPAALTRWESAREGWRASAARRARRSGPGGA